MKTLRVPIYAIILSALLPAAGIGEQGQAQPSGVGSLPGGPKTTGDSAHKANLNPDKQGKTAGSTAESGAVNDRAADAAVDPPIRQRRRPGYSHVKTLSKGKGSKSALGAYTKKYQHHAGEKGGQKEKPASGESHVSIPGETLKEQEAKLHLMAKPLESATEARPIIRQPTPSAPGWAGNSPVRTQGLFPTQGRHSPNPAIIGGGTITSRNQSAAVIGGATIGGSR